MFVYIYKLIKKDAINDDIVYIGSTDDIEARMSKHKYSCNNIKQRDYNRKVYKYIRDNGGFDEWTYEIIDEVEVALRNDAARYEGEYIIKYDAINKLNDRVAGQCLNKSINQYHKEYRERNKERLSQKDKEKHERNKEVISQKKKEYYERNKGYILQSVNEYRNKNKDAINQRRREYNEQNKDDINERRRERRRLAKLNTL
jgi:predicted GIY-YIG superfamily endonuclease